MTTLFDTIDAALEAAQVVANILKYDGMSDEEKAELIDHILKG